MTRNCRTRNGTGSGNAGTRQPTRIERIVERRFTRVLTVDTLARRDLNMATNTNMKLLLTNDDGVDAPGLEALLQVAEQFGDSVVVAPADAMSGCSHRVTTDQAFRVRERHSSCYVVDGTPADCVRVGLHRLNGAVSWVLSGINAGGNLGSDVHHSGTVAAVREAVLHGCPGIAVSNYRKQKGQEPDWQRAIAWVIPVIKDLLNQTWTPGTFWNINLPHVEPDSPDPEVVFCRLDPSPLPLSFQTEGELLRYDADYHLRPRQAGSDVDVCFGGRIAVTRVSIH